jgi:hypothetical protein
MFRSISIDARRRSVQDRSGAAVVAGSPAAANERNTAKLQRETLGTEPDEVHGSMIELFRREQGFPPGGVDASAPPAATSP